MRFRHCHGMVVACAFAAAGAAHADPIYTFNCITNNSVPNGGAGEAQLALEVLGSGPAATFRFSNAGPAVLVITDVYFQDGTLLGISSVGGSPGVSFSIGANPSNLPGGASIDPPFQTTVGFSADADPPVFANGVGPGEWLEVNFALLPGMTYESVLAALDDRSLRVGIHVQGYVDGGSESFVNVPAPGAACVLAMAVLISRRRRR